MLYATGRYRTRTEEGKLILYKELKNQENQSRPESHPFEPSNPSEQQVELLDYAKSLLSKLASNQLAELVPILEEITGEPSPNGKQAEDV